MFIIGKYASILAFCFFVNQGMEPMIDACESGLPVDLAQVLYWWLETKP